MIMNAVKIALAIFIWAAALDGVWVVMKRVRYKLLIRKAKQMKQQYSL